ncbi:LCP family protein [Chloroflexota bacterium]
MAQEFMQMEKSASSRWLRLLLWIAFFIAALLVAYLTFISVRDFVIRMEGLVDLPGVSIQDAPPTPAPGVESVEGGAPLPVQSPSGPTPEPWDGAQRVSMLMMGLDFRDWQAGEGPPRTDTMILLTIDPVSRTAGMISIPRDLWVNIPGYDYGRINTAYQLGEGTSYPGGGPALAAVTVEQLLGVPVDYYAQIDFGAFIRFIDELGGVVIEVPRRIKVDPMGDDNTQHIKPGRQLLSGELALAYARARKTEGGDFDRAERQQQVILGIRYRILKFDMLPTLVTNSPALYAELSSGIRTNLALEDAVRLAWLAMQIPDESIKRAIIGTDQVAFAMSPDGTQEVLKPLTEKIRLLRDEIFTEGGPISPAAGDLSTEEVLLAEGARITVLNGSSTAGLAARTAEYLQSLGFTVVATGNADRHTANSEITYYSGKPYTVDYLVSLMNIGKFRVRHLFDPANEADIMIVVGDDWALTNSMP